VAGLSEEEPVRVHMRAQDRKSFQPQCDLDLTLYVEVLTLAIPFPDENVVLDVKFKPLTKGTKRTLPWEVSSRVLNVIELGPKWTEEKKQTWQFQDRGMKLGKFFRNLSSWSEVKQLVQQYLQEMKHPPPVVILNFTATEHEMGERFPDPGRCPNLSSYLWWIRPRLSRASLPFTFTLSVSREGKTKGLLYSFHMN
jgi:hypothetical protein